MPKQHPRGVSSALQKLAPISYLDSTPDIIVEGFPRSGNTFLHCALRLTWPELIIQSHTHDPEEVVAADGSIPFIFLVRDPIEAVPSWLVHLSAYPDRWSDVDTALFLYERLIKSALNNPNVFILPFTALISDINRALKTLAERFPLPSVYKIPSTESIIKYVSEVSRSVMPDDEGFSKTGHAPRLLHPLNKVFKEKLNEERYRYKIEELNQVFNKVSESYYARS